MSALRFASDTLRQFAADAYEALGLRPVDARRIADSLAQADLWGHQSHGVMRTAWYARRIASGATDIRSVPEIVTDAGAIALLDGKDGPGQPVAWRAMDEAVARARKHGIGAVSVCNSGHFGTAMYYTRRAAMDGCIGVMTTNASPAMAPWGGREKLIGTNPWSIAAPAGVHSAMMLDIANTAVARGKLYLARQRNEPIPSDWAIDADGNPTTDAALGIAGNILPFAGHKGYAIATMINVLSGILSGSGFGDSVVGPYEPLGRSGVGHLALAIDIAAIRPIAAFEADMEAFIARIKTSPRAANVDEIFYPGEREARAEAAHLRDGIELPDDTLAELDDFARDMDLPTLSSRA